MATELQMSKGRQIARLAGLGLFRAARDRLQQKLEDSLSAIYDSAAAWFEPPPRKRRVDRLQDVWSASMALMVTVIDKPRATFHRGAARDFDFQGRCREVYADFGERDVVDGDEGLWCTRQRLDRGETFARMENHNKYLTSPRTVVYR